MGPLAPSPSCPLLPCPLLQSVASPMWAPESINADPLPFLLLLQLPPFYSPPAPFIGWSIPLILAPSPNPPHPTPGLLQLL